MGPDPQLQRAVINAMASRDDRSERRPWGPRMREDRQTAPPPADRPGYPLLGLGGAVRAVPRLALRVGRHALATPGWRR
jgi:hypothetical protein